MNFHQKNCDRSHMLQMLRLFLAILGLTVVAASQAQTQTQTQTPTTLQKPLDVPYVPTPQPVVDKMLEIAKVTKKDVIYDLGCGDGRIVNTAAKRYGARGVGIDLNPQRIAEANSNAASAGVQDRVKFMTGDLYQADFSNATVVTLYLLSSVNEKLRPQLWRQLKVGTRVVSHAFDMGSAWPPERMEIVNGNRIYYWTITQANKNAAK